MRIRVLTVALALSLVAIPSWSQWKETIQPPNSPYWWTLTDEVTPQELRRVYLDQSFHYAQYQKAQELGLWPSLSEEEQDDIALFIVGALTPQYHCFAEALWRFSGQVEYDLKMNRPKQAKALSDHGLSQAGVARVIAVIAETLEAAEVLIKELDHDQRAFSEILIKMREELPLEKYQEILRKRQFARMARLAGEDVGAVKQYAESWDRDPHIETYSAASAVLKDELSEKDWQLLRSYLLERFASTMNNVTNYSDTVRGWVGE